MVYEKAFFFATLRFSTRIWEKPIYYKERNHSGKAICEGAYMFSQAENLWQKRCFWSSIRTNGWKLAYIAICPWTRDKIFVCLGIEQEKTCIRFGSSAA
ncbi:hypothetical protein BHF69_07480 [Anaerostipes sp. 992a]|nr:hypothetical protein BHF69_07480 [Anaerostipes sp. 992a]